MNMTELHPVALDATKDHGPRVAGAARWATPALVVVGLVGVALRLRMLLIGRSFWLDEAMLALNICGRSFGDLLKPLSYDQGAPIGFLFAERAAVLALGPTELALRLFPFLASIAALALVGRLCGTIGGRWAAVVGVALAGVSPALIYYSGELKQYSSDVTLALLILALIADALRLGLTARRAAVLAVVGAGAVWFSHPAVFVLAGAGSTLILKELWERRFATATLAAAMAAAWLVSFAVQYVLFTRSLQGNAALSSYWESGFLRFPPRSPRDLHVYSALAFGLFESLFLNFQVNAELASRMGVFMAAAWLIGAATLIHQGRRQVLVLLVAPLAFAAVGSMLHVYPLKGRLALFTAASTLPVIALGIAGLMATRDALNRTTGALLLGCALLLPTLQSIQSVVERPRLHDAPGVLAAVARDWRPGDVVVMDRYSAPPFEFYQQYGHVDRLGAIQPITTELALTEPEELAREIRRHRGSPRVWFLLDASLPDPTDLSRDALRVLLDQAGRRIESFTARRYSAHLYRFD